MNVAQATRTSPGFTLVELLITIALIAALAGSGLAVFSTIKEKAEQATCLGNLRQIGLAVISYSQDHNSSFPLSTHQLDASNMDQGWIHSISPYLADVDQIRICPADPKKAERLASNGTSYLLNSYLTVEKTDPFGNPLSGGFTKTHQLPDPARTPLAFITNFEKGTGFTNDHTHSESWSSWQSVVRDIQPDAFGGDDKPDRSSGSSNYLYADGHAEQISATTVRKWILSGHNFANPLSFQKN
ncbi:type II secretion system protein [Luteolibacter algae]|uniref:Type II secretion system protein n=1 Tax=Luteolibacter algae TaxID=454151 RepID=A0ABW5D622_9BACT